ncbi:hypothetical protein QBC44DRAFT_314669 [Cladorrhinum sp. PSN332]|nr:hypothetical protein QBC44DRAFT_314669 [Cladorrhinum sp. PSN332]
MPRAKRAALAEQNNVPNGRDTLASSAGDVAPGQENPLPVTKSRKRKSDTDLASTSTSAAPATKKSKSASSAGSLDPHDVSSVTLPDDVPIYDTCNEIRRKIRLFLRKPGVTQASFLRAISACSSTGKSIAASSLRLFLEKKRPLPLDGNTSAVYYASYVFFEKVRLRDGKPKTKHREGMEDAWGREGGVPTDRPMKNFIVLAGETPVVDQFGRVQIMGRHY